MNEHFQNGCEKARQDIENKMLDIGMKVENIDSSLMKQLESKGFYGLIDKLKRGEITEDQARRSLAGDKNAIPLPGMKKSSESLIFGRTASEIAKMQKSGALK